ncbi:MAG: hypothetical protein AAFR75_05720, partial [Pseudomonadota bacterium]
TIDPAVVFAIAKPTSASSAAEYRRYVRPSLRSFLLLLGLTCGASVMGAEPAAWPALPEIGYISGRAATTEDVDAGNAVFALKAGDEYIGEPVQIEIPQYAFHADSDTGEKTPVVVVQAETDGDVTAIGFRYISDGSTGVGLIGEFELLGQQKPS